MKINGAEQKMQVYIYAVTSPLIFDKGHKTYDQEKTTSSANFAGKTGYLHVEN
jgi:hypothetical protein